MEQIPPVNISNLVLFGLNSRLELSFFFFFLFFFSVFLWTVSVLTYWLLTMLLWCQVPRKFPLYFWWRWRKLVLFVIYNLHLSDIHIFVYCNSPWHTFVAWSSFVIVFTSITILLIGLERIANLLIYVITFLLWQVLGMFLELWVNNCNL